MIRCSFAVVAVLAGVAAAHAETGVSPYAGLESRSVKALSAEEVVQLRDGKGMGLALAAELNGHPGPLHVIELSESLGLSEAQLALTQDVYDSMSRKAKVLGAEVLALEARLDELFRSPRPDAGAVDTLTLEIGRARGALRAVHLGAHLRMNDILSAEQRHRYAALRGYDGAGAHHRGHSGGGGYGR